MGYELTEIRLDCVRINIRAPSHYVPASSWLPPQRHVVVRDSLFIGSSKPAAEKAWRHEGRVPLLKTNI